MHTLEYTGEVMQGGDVIVPDSIKKRLAAFTHHKIAVHIEIFEDDETPEYSFQRVRHLLRSVEGNLSSDIREDRGERV